MPGLGTGSRHGGSWPAAPSVRRCPRLPSVAPPLQDPHQLPVPADDCDGAQWFPVAKLRGLKGAVAADAMAATCWL